MEYKERKRMEAIREEKERKEARDRQIALVARTTDMRPILRKATGPCLKFRCVACHNYDKNRELGYTCLIKGRSRENPGESKVCCYFISQRQIRLTLGATGVP